MEEYMRLWLLLFVLSVKLKIDAKRNEAFKKYIGTTRLKFLIKTADNKWGRLFIFDNGAVTTLSGADHQADAALVWADPATAFRVMLAQTDTAAFNAAAAGKMKVEGMAYYVQWFNDAMKLIM
jgi:hypothetical protein